MKFSKPYILIAASFVVTMTTFSVLVWNIVRTDEEIRDLQRNIHGLKETVDHLSLNTKEITEKDTMHNVQLSTVTNQINIDTNESTENANAVLSTNSLPIENTSTYSVTLSTEETTAAATTTTTRTTTETTAPTSVTTTAVATTSTIITTATTTMFEVPDDTNIEVLRSEEVMYGGYSFLAVQIRVPSDGLSKSENWCREYQYLCEHFSRRPTGCSGEPYNSTSPYKECGSDYNSDMDIGNVLGCNPGKNITDLINKGLENLSTSARNVYNVFGFNECSEVKCQKTLRGSETALTHTRGFWIDNERIMFTVCR